jgi:hypothetical protein
MAYFRIDIPCQHFQDSWQELINHVNTQWSQSERNQLSDLEFSLEAKSLSIFSLSRRWANSAAVLAQNIATGSGERWDLVFVEALTLLFPMIELIGSARLGSFPVNQTSWHRLIAGLEWLREPSAFPSGNGKNEMRADTTRMARLGEQMKIHSPEGPLLNDLFEIRNYFLHGTRDGGVNHIPDLLNYELPMAIANVCQEAMQLYWSQLRLDDGTHGWLENLSRARIHPFVIQGSGIFDCGLLDPDIVDSWLE